MKNGPDVYTNCGLIQIYFQVSNKSNKTVGYVMILRELMQEILYSLVSVKVMLLLFIMNVFVNGLWRYVIMFETIVNNTSTMAGSVNVSS